MSAQGVPSSQVNATTHRAPAQRRLMQ